MPKGREREEREREEREREEREREEREREERERRHTHTQDANVHTNITKSFNRYVYKRVTARWWWCLKS